jgi:hypothetical protein
MADIREMIETVLAAHLRTETSATVYTGTNDGDKALPCVIVEAPEYEEMVPESAVYRVRVAVHVKGAVDDLTNHNALAAAAHRAIRFNHGEWAALGTSALRIYGIGEAESHEASAESDVFTDTYTTELVCSPLTST